MFSGGKKEDKTEVCGHLIIYLYHVFNCDESSTVHSNTSDYGFEIIENGHKVDIYLKTKL
jgi:hypothetical protein